MKARELKEKLERATGKKFNGPVLRVDDLHIEFLNDVPGEGPYIAVHYKGLTTFVDLVSIHTVYHDRFGIQLADDRDRSLLLLDRGECLGTT